MGLRLLGGDILRVRRRILEMDELRGCIEQRLGEIGDAISLRLRFILAQMYGYLIL